MKARILFVLMLSFARLCLKWIFHYQGFSFKGYMCSCDWVVFKQNTPNSSDMIGLVPNAPQILLHRARRQLDNELLRTFMTEAETVVNTRPLLTNAKAARMIQGL